MIGHMYATVIHCQEADNQRPISEFIKRNYRLEIGDFISESEPIKQLAENNNKEALNSIKKKILISFEVHNSKLIAIVGHQNCIGNAADKETQYAYIRSAVNTVKFWNLSARIVALWMDEDLNITEIQ